MAERHSHCSFCGEAYPSGASWPRRCEACEQVTFRNPTPVAVVVLPVDDGVLAIRRGIEPRRGQLALPGGFVDFGETWQQACARELFEETGISIDSGRIELITAENAPGVILLFGRAAPMQASELPPFTPTHETTERVILRDVQPLAFPLHTRILAQALGEAVP